MTEEEYFGEEFTDEFLHAPDGAGDGYCSAKPVNDESKAYRFMCGETVRHGLTYDIGQ
jgi:hypothetical protein